MWLGSSPGAGLAPFLSGLSGLTLRGFFKATYCLANALILLLVMSLDLHRKFCFLPISFEDEAVLVTNGWVHRVCYIGPGPCCLQAAHCIDFFCHKQLSVLVAVTRAIQTALSEKSLVWFHMAAKTHYHKSVGLPQQKFIHS